MSIALMTEAWKADMPSGRKFVLLSLCDNANDQGECYPSIPMIAKRCSMSERAVQGHVQDLRKAGILAIHERHGRSSIYTINPRRICTPAESAPPQNLHPTPAESAPITVIEPSIEPSVNRQAPRKAVSIDRPDEVDEQVWIDFLAIRKAKRSPLSATALAGIAREADKAGITLSDALVVCCERGWTGFRADWYASTASRTAAQQPVETFRERDQRLARERWEQATGQRHPDSQPAAGRRSDVIDIAPAAGQAHGSTFPALPF
jgi:DNA-binding transcriptional ArsR family regulator